VAEHDDLRLQNIQHRAKEVSSSRPRRQRTRRSLTSQKTSRDVA
jgi:hypothetical protein